MNLQRLEIDLQRLKIDLRGLKWTPEA